MNPSKMFEERWADFVLDDTQEINKELLAKIFYKAAVKDTLDKVREIAEGFRLKAPECHSLNTAETEELKITNETIDYLLTKLTISHD